MKALLNYRTAINLSLILTLGLGPALTYLHADDSAQLRSSDLVIQSLQAKKAGDMNQYRELLTQAKKNLGQTELMTTASQRIAGRTLDEMINNPKAAAPQAPTGDAQTDLIAANPEAREVLYDMAMGRQTNASTMMDGLMMTVSNETGAQFDINDQNAATLDLMNPTVDLVAKVFQFLGIVKIDPKVDLSVIRRNDPGYNPDVVARNLINKQANQAALMAGGISLAANIARQRIPNKYLQAAGLTTTGYLIMRLNTQLMQDVAALYGQPIRDANAFEAFAISVLYLAQIYSTLNNDTLSTAQVKAAAEQVGENLVLLQNKTWAGKARGYFSRILNKANSQKLFAGGKLGAQNVANLSGLPADPAQPVPTGTQPAPGPAPAPAPGPVATTPDAPIKRFPWRAGLQAALSIGLRTARDTVLAEALTQAVGRAAMDIARAAAKKSQQERDQAFYKFMEGSAGEQFVNMLIISSQSSDNPVKDMNFAKSSDKRLTFLRGVSRMAHICSSDDIRVANGRIRAVGNRGSAADRIAIYDCGSQTSTAPYTRMLSNFVNFKGIMTNEQSMTALRRTAKSNRLKMAQMVNQFQRLDGDRDPEEAAYFETVRKLLGLDDPLFDEYFQQYDSHVSDNHGPQADAQSPTGFIVLGNSQAVPFSERKAGVAPSDALILDSDILQAGQTSPTNTNTNTNTTTPGQGGTWTPAGGLPPLTPAPQGNGGQGAGGQTCNPNVNPGCQGNVPAPGATRSWLHIDNLKGV